MVCEYKIKKYKNNFLKKLKLIGVIRVSYLYTNEIVFRGHPDKVCDQISDALLDQYIKGDKNSRCGIETMGGKGKIFITGEVTSSANVDVESTVKRVLREVGYNDNYEIINNLGVQSPDIAMGVDIGGAGDQGMMFGYACRDTNEMLPLAMVILQRLAQWYNEQRKYDTRFLPDGKAQITGVYDDDGNLLKIEDFVISYQNTEQEREKTDEIIKGFCNIICETYGIQIKNYYINPTGKFLIGGFEGDSGLTGRKIVVDNYQSFANVGGGAFSGKDPSKVDRSAAYKARQMAKSFLKQTPNIDWCEVQLSYAIGMIEPLSIYVKTNKGRLYVPNRLYEECSPCRIIDELQLLKPIYEKTARFGHFGNEDFSWEQ